MIKIFNEYCQILKVETYCNNKFKKLENIKKVREKQWLEMVHVGLYLVISLLSFEENFYSMEKKIRGYHFSRSFYRTFAVDMFQGFSKNNAFNSLFTIS